VHENHPDIDSVDGPVGRGPLSVARDRDAREQQQRERVCTVSDDSSSSGGHDIQSTEHIPPINPRVLLYPTKKLSGFLYFSPAK
jgi:hypothetical protein